MRLETQLLTLHPRHPFAIARGSVSEAHTVWVRVIDDDGVEGWGEAAGNRFYGETADTVLAALRRYGPLLDGADPWAVDAVEAELAAALRGNPSARAAISAALHDLLGKRLGLPVWKLWGLDAARAPRSSYTIGIVDDEAALRRRVAEAAAYPVLKIKLGGPRDEWMLRTVRDAAPDHVLRVDANAAWSPKRALAMLPLLVECGVEFVEQPVAAHDLEGLRFVRERSPLPVIADESCLVASDVPRLAGCVDGVNLKLAKCGSLREALRIVHVARAHGLLVMAGCMLESSLGISAAAQLAPLLDHADLDGAALLADDPFTGATIDGGRIALPTGPGLGVARRPDEP